MNKNKPFTVNQVTATKPNVKKSDPPLHGYIANSLNGGHNKTIAWKQVMAGEKHKEYRIKAKFQMLTPLTPTYQNLKATIRAYFVPNSRVWENAEKFTAQKGGNTEIKIEKIPNLGGFQIPVTDNLNGLYTIYTNTQQWRDSFISSYVPRQGKFDTSTVKDDLKTTFPAVSILGIRGRVAIFNDMERHKEYEPERQEFKGDTVTAAEFNSYIPYYGDLDFYTMRAKKENSYYTDYRTELQGFEETKPTNTENQLINWASWEAKIAEARSQAENAQKNDWEIIAQIRGSKLLSEGKVQKIGERTFNLNYAAITQNAYNNNEQIREEFRVMGKQGAYSYTEIDMPIYAGVEFNEEGYVHFIMTVSADSVYESGYDRLELNVNALDQYRPDLIQEKQDVLYKIETGTENYNTDKTEILGFKRKYSEYFKLPNIIGGDMTTKNYFQMKLNDGEYQQFYFDEESQIITQKTFQFFESDLSEYFDESIEGGYVSKHIWKDYTDLLINKNQAVKNPVTNDAGTGGEGLIVMGNNQIFFLGETFCYAELPIDDSIKNNYTVWGEH